MALDRRRLAEVLSAEYSYYEGPEPTCDIDARLNPDPAAFIAAHLNPDMKVLDVGCGSGTTLLRNSGSFEHAIGIDHDHSHIELAEKARLAAGITNVEFIELTLEELPKRQWPQPFDFVFSERGPIGYDVRGVQAALHVLRPGGTIFAELIGDLHHQEVRDVFSQAPRFNQVIRALDQVKVAMERCGVGVRVAADIVSKRYYPDIYEWLKFQCSIWAWTGASLPTVDDPRLDMFAMRNADNNGRIEVTHHVVWVGGIKLEDPPRYAEHQHFRSRT